MFARGEVVETGRIVGSEMSEIFGRRGEQSEGHEVENFPVVARVGPGSVRGMTLLTLPGRNNKKRE
jgi:hypothetical protein